jgi:hypothetical protein
MAWLTPEQAIHKIASDEIAWSVGSPVVLFRGGFNRITGLQSELTSPPIIAIVGSDQFHKKAKMYPTLSSNEQLFRRDLNICAYCGNHFHDKQLSRDHIIPTSRDGANSWMNCITACKKCNQLKDNRTPEEAGMHLLYVPYRPCRYEKFLLEGRRILADQANFLMAKLPKHSRALM